MYSCPGLRRAFIEGKMETSKQGLVSHMKPNSYFFRVGNISNRTHYASNKLLSVLCFIKCPHHSSSCSGQKWGDILVTFSSYNVITQSILKFCRFYLQNNFQFHVLISVPMSHSFSSWVVRPLKGCLSYLPLAQDLA